MSQTVLLIVVAVVVVVAIVALLARRGGAKDAPADESRVLPDADAPRQVQARSEATPPPAPPEATAPAAAPEEPADDEAEAPDAPPAPPAEEASLTPEPPAPPPEPPAAPAEPPASREEDLAALRKGLAGTRKGFVSSLSRLFKRSEPVDAELLEEIEHVLITADIGVRTADAILEALRSALEAGEIGSGEEAWAALRAHAARILTRPGGGPVVVDKQPTVILVVGVNGAGKTTTIGKLASRFQQQGKDVLLAAGDTFRAAAVLQLEVWGKRTGCDVVKGKDRADPGSVIFDAISKGVERGVDVVIADTAGRLHTKAPLMEELKKVGRSAEKALGRPVDEILLVLDSTTGQNAIQQAELFRDALPVSGIALTKLDGTAKGGVILGIVDAHGLPVRYVGVGERVEDLRDFDAESFVEALFSPAEDEAAA